MRTLHAEIVRAKTYKWITDSIGPQHVTLKLPCTFQEASDTLTKTSTPGVAHHDIIDDCIQQLYSYHELPTPAVMYAESPHHAIDLVRHFKLGRYSHATQTIRFLIRTYARIHARENTGASTAHQNLYHQLQTGSGSALGYLRDLRKGLLRSAWKPGTETDNRWRTDTTPNPWITATDLEWLGTGLLDYNTPNKAALALLYQCTSKAHLMLLHDNIAIVVNYPIAYRTDREGRFHGETELAVEYVDGMGEACWHGQIIPHEWITRGLPAAADALEIPNMELRRCAFEMIGWDNIINELGYDTIDTNIDPQIGILIDVMMPQRTVSFRGLGSRKSRFLRVQCGTGRWFALQVPRTCSTALEANAWTYGIEPSEYNPQVRT